MIFVIFQQMMQSTHQLTELSLKEQLSSIDSQLVITSSNYQKLKEDNKALLNAISQRKVDDVNTVSG